jgi:hypothetical protein
MVKVSLNSIEKRRLEEQARLDKSKNGWERNQLGQYATPPKLASEVVELAVKIFEIRREKIQFLDPAFGTGALYSALVKSASIENISSAVGFEVDPAVATVARELWSGKPFSVSIVEADFTSVLLPSVPQANLIVCNPPYVRHHHLLQSTKAILQERVREATNLRINGLAGLYCYFMLLSHKWLGEGGIGVWLVPTEFMDVKYGKVIREYLSKYVTLRRLHRFDPSKTKFEDALVSSTVVVFEKTLPMVDHQVLLTYGDSLAQPVEVYTIPARRLSEQQKWSSRPIHMSLKKKDSWRTVLFGDLFTVQRGIATGANSFFILPRKKAEELGLPKEFLRPILPGPRYLLDTVIRADDDGLPQIESQLVLIDCSLFQEVVKKQYPLLWKYYLQGIDLGIHKRYLTSKRNPWYKQEYRQPAQFLATYMGRTVNGTLSLRFIWNTSKATVTNAYHTIYPKPQLAIYLQQKPEACRKIFELLNQITATELIDKGRTHGGGLHKVEPRELYQLTLSNLESARSLFADMPWLSNLPSWRNER